MATEQGPVLIMLPVPKPQGVVVGDDGARCAISDGLSLPGQAGREESSAVADRAEVSDGESLSPTLDLQIPSSEPEPWLSLTWWTGHTGDCHQKRAGCSQGRNYRAGGEAAMVCAWKGSSWKVVMGGSGVQG